MMLLGLALPYAGFTALCLAMERHHEHVFGRRRIPSLRRRVLQITGWLLLAVSLVPCFAVAGWGVGGVLWCGLLTAAALPLAILLAFRPRAVIPLALVSLPLGLLASAFDL
jgi:hypothetical protein